MLQRPENFFHLNLSRCAQVLNLSEEEIFEAIVKDSDDLDPRDQIIYEGVCRFTKIYQISFKICAIQAIELYSRKKVLKEDVEKHLIKKFGISPNSSLNPNDSFCKAYKTIMIVGRTGEGKSLTVNHLVGKDVAKIGEAHSATVGTNLYVSDRCKLNIIDTEGLDGTHTTETNQELMEKIRHQALFYLEFDASIDAILIMWCPIKNGRSGLAKTIQALQKSFGDDVIKSCIVVIQGNWRPWAEALDLTHAVPEAIQEIQTNFPEIPIIEYDAKGPFDNQLPLLEETIRKVRPYQQEFFEENKKLQFLNLARLFNYKLKKFLNKEFEQRQRQVRLPQRQHRQQSQQQRDSSCVDICSIF